MRIEIKRPTLENLCPYCFGSGKLKAMQSVMTYKGHSIRVEDTKIKCNRCDGTGRVME